LDYTGAMGVPITFLHKYHPEQFEIIKFRKGNDEKDLSINGKCPYFRILIRNKRTQKNEKMNQMPRSELINKKKEEKVFAIKEDNRYFGGV